MRGRDPEVRLRALGAWISTERAVFQIVCDLDGAGYLTRERVGRHNRYQVHPEGPLRHPVVEDRQVGELLEVLVGRGPDGQEPGLEALAEPTASSDVT